MTERDAEGALKYRRVDVRHGYLGYFASKPDARGEGIIVNVVGPGTPADLAGIQPGDLITSLNRQAVSSEDDVNAILMETKPGDILELEVVRGSAAAADQNEEGEAAKPLAARGPPLTLTATLTHHPLDLVRLARHGGADQIAGNLSRLSCLVTLGQVNRKKISSGEAAIEGIPDPAELNWEHATRSSDDEHRVDFHVDLSAKELETIGGDAVRLHRSYRLMPGSYTIDMSVAIENLAEDPQQLAYRLEGPNGVTLEGWWYSTRISQKMFSGAAAREVVYKSEAESHTMLSGYRLAQKGSSGAGITGAVDLCRRWVGRSEIAQVHRDRCPIFCRRLFAARGRYSADDLPPRGGRRGC